MAVIQRTPLGMNPTRKDVRAKLSTLNTRYAGAGADQQQRIGDRAAWLTDRYQIKRSPFTANQTPLAPTAPAQTPAPIAQATPAQKPSNLETMFPSTRMFEPQNYQGSPLYQFQVDRGQKQLTKSLAARGLGNSGYAIQEEVNIPLQAAAQDTDRMTRVASENADRLSNYQNNEALRQERAGNNQWDRSYNIASLMAAQSPYNSAVAGLDNSARAKDAAGSANANFLKDYYNRVYSSGGGGGGFTPLPLPTGPNYTGMDPAVIKGNQTSNQGWLDILTSGLGSLFTPSAGAK